MNTKRKAIKRIGALLGIFFICLAIYTVWENRHVLIRTQSIEISGLPDEFDGFTILQISDLHGSSFGEKQSTLLKAIHSADYDLIVFTGDMNKGTESDPASSAALIDLIEGLKGEQMYWVDGNCGPYAEDRSIFPTGCLTEMGEYLKDLGVISLLEPVKIERDNASIYLTPKLSWEEIDEIFPSVDLSSYPAEAQEKMIAFNRRQHEWYRTLDREDTVLIAVSHYPEQSYLSDATWDIGKHLSYDLMIAGHTHGGQIRLPVIGALYIPIVSSERGGYFPKEADTRGLQYICGIPQYVSAGLGASASYKWLDFRFLCPPEINRIVLRQRQ